MNQIATRRHVLALLASLAIVFTLSACRSAFVQTSLENKSDAPIRLIEVDYPSASFGSQSLAAHTSFHYHFKVQGTGPVTLTFTDQAGKVHTVAGPVLTEGQQGELRISIDRDGSVNWTKDLSIAK
jgi:hypothetical protein